MTKSLLRPASTAAVGAILVAILASLSGCAPSPPACADAPIYLLDNTTAMPIPAGTTLEWDARNGVVLTANPAPSDLGDLSWATFAPVEGARYYVAFLATPGAERTPTTWKQWGDADTINSGVVLPAVWPGHLTGGTPAAVKSAGGTYSMGIALTDGPAVASAHVVEAYFATINVDADAGAWTLSDSVVCTGSTARSHQ